MNKKAEMIKIYVIIAMSTIFLYFLLIRQFGYYENY